ncbi:MAG TPA: [Fe-Fe] hydrogenase large subunit C-terminal domain-containing protein [Synergistales bacterium]|nr:[Fe-Fe] hydrogenase large subunit C-terminal domain-containing protein [Synergistales bacterium]
MAGGIKVQEVNCAGCANCIKSCPTEAMRVIDGCVSIINELCIDCGECMRNCPHKAIMMDEDEWDLISSQENVVTICDPTFYVQMGAYTNQNLVKQALKSWNVTDMADYTSLAFDIAAYSISRMLENESPQNLPLISTYCPAVIRLIQINFPELVGRVVPVDSPFEVAVAIWREITGRNDDVTLLVPCPAKITLIRNPVGREESNAQYAVSVRKLVRALLAGGPKVSAEQHDEALNNRWLKWSVTGGESAHIAAFSQRPLKTISVSGLRNTMDLLKEMELGRLRGIDFIECRVCDLGCIGGVGNAESRFLSKSRLDHMNINWNIAADEIEILRGWHEKGIYKLDREITATRRNPLATDLNSAMSRLKELNRIYSELPHIDCGSCGRPSCRALAEDIIRGQGEMTDCIFKLRETISELSREIADLAEHTPHTLRGKRV